MGDNWRPRSSTCVLGSIFILQSNYLTLLPVGIVFQFSNLKNLAKVSHKLKMIIHIYMIKEYLPKYLSINGQKLLKKNTSYHLFFSKGGGFLQISTELFYCDPYKA